MPAFPSTVSMASILACFVFATSAHASPSDDAAHVRLVENTDPTQCGMTTPQYGTVGMGSIVTLGRHTPWTGPTGVPTAPFVTADDNWADEMDAYVGRRATVVELSGLDSAGCAGVRVDVDGQAWFWRVRDFGHTSGGFRN